MGSRISFIHRTIFAALLLVFSGCTLIFNDNGQSSVKDAAVNSDASDRAVDAETVQVVFDGQINVSEAVNENGFAYRVTQDFGTPSDSSINFEVSTLRIFEDGLQLGPPHSPHVDIRETGTGKFSHWEVFLYFSASDNSDPRSNGRDYSYVKNVIPDN